MFKSSLDQRKQTGYLENPKIIKPSIDKIKIDPQSHTKDPNMNVLRRTDPSTYNEWKNLNKYFSSKYKEFYKKSAKELLLAPRVTTLESRAPLSIIHFNISKNLHKEFKPKFQFKKAKTEKMLKRMERAEKYIENEIKKRTFNNSDDDKEFKHKENKEEPTNAPKDMQEFTMTNNFVSSNKLKRVQSAQLNLNTNNLLASSISIAAYRIQSSKNNQQNVLNKTPADNLQCYSGHKTQNTATKATNEEMSNLPANYLLKGSGLRLFSANSSVNSTLNNQRIQSCYSLSKKQSFLKNTKNNNKFVEPNKSTFTKSRINSAMLYNSTKNIRFSSTKINN